ncbi:hypothetical protein [Microbacterium sp. CPCC 204701]|uniref:hypothetical protein n=1 Tax=Microbacterium sp. CPCC 204701 TaxID=2493084 RepID=UPI000FDCC3C3|nr:hypothetical protein [Microbacterium sp. CPCC 204701]
MTDVAGRAGGGALFTMAAALAGYAVWAFAQADALIRTARESGQLGEGTEFDVASYFMSNVGVYSIAAVTLAALGWVLLRSTPSPRRTIVAQQTTARPTPPEDDLEDLFDSVPT